MKHDSACRRVCGSLLVGMVVTAGGRVTASGACPDPGFASSFTPRGLPISCKDNCLACHDETAKGGLRLDSYAAIRKGGDDGAVIVPGDPDTSMLIQAIRRTGDLKMPPKHPLEAAELRILKHG